MGFNGSLWWLHGILWEFMVTQFDLMGVYGDFMGFMGVYGDLIGFNGSSWWLNGI